jgi:hypothetical protein
MNKHEILDYLKKNVIVFLDQLIYQFPSEGDLMLFQLFLKSSVSSEKMMSYFTITFLPHSRFILEKNEEFFLTQFSTEDEKKYENKIAKFKTLWKQLDDENKEVMWSWFNNFLRIAEKYQSL